MRRILLVASLGLGLLAGTACRTVPQSKPLSALSEAEQIAYNQTAPLEKPQEPGVELADVMRTVGAVVVFIPVFIWQSLAWGGAQISTGK